MNKTMLRKYAKLVVAMGANIQKGQGCVINAPVEQHEFTKLVGEEAYRRGAKWVRIDWQFQEFTKIKYRHESATMLSQVPAWEEAKAQYSVDNLPAMIHILSDDPDGLKGINLDKLQKATIARTKILKKYRDAQDEKIQWTIVGVPCEKWAKKVFPNDRTSTAMNKLWDAIFESVRITKDNDPVKEWEAHNAKLKEKYQILNNYKFDYLHYTNGVGTDFKCWLNPKGKWAGGGDTTLSGVFFNPNMPTEEVFTSPVAGKAEGKVVSTKPLSYQGQLIDDFSITFENGKAVSWEAKEGQGVLDKMLGMDDGAKMLGELALVPYDSPISNTGLLFFETLYDENASCHVALGRGFANCLEGFEDMSKDEQTEAGINDSLIHVDFMIGSKDMSIVGYTKEGEKVQIFKDGDWAI